MRLKAIKELGVRGNKKGMGLFLLTNGRRINAENLS